jgi:dipeptidyl aminopeptidase/acylaminoacyl peptidase
MKIDKALAMIFLLLFISAFAIGTLRVSASGAEKPGLTQLISFRTSDGVTLAGQLFEPQTKSNRVLIMIPGGSGSNLRPEGHDFKPLYERLNEKGIALFLQESRHGGKDGWLAVKEYSNFAKDTQAAIQIMKDRGYTDIALFGISFGGTRLSYYLGATEWDRSVKVAGYVNTILSIEQAAKDTMTDEEWKKFLAARQEVRDLIAAGKEDQVVTVTIGGGRKYTMDAHTMIQIIGTREETDSHSLKWVGSIKMPALVIHGVKDPDAPPYTHEMLFKAFTSASKKNLIAVEGSTHYIKGAFAEEYAEKIADWVDKNMPSHR